MTSVSNTADTAPTKVTTTVREEMRRSYPQAESRGNRSGHETDQINKAGLSGCDQSTQHRLSAPIAAGRSPPGRRHQAVPMLCARYSAGSRRRRQRLPGAADHEQFEQPGGIGTSRRVYWGLSWRRPTGTGDQLAVADRCRRSWCRPMPRHDADDRRRSTRAEACRCDGQGEVGEQVQVAWCCRSPTTQTMSSRRPAS